MRLDEHPVRQGSEPSFVDDFEAESLEEAVDDPVGDGIEGGICLGLDDGRDLRIEFGDELGLVKERDEEGERSTTVGGGFVVRKLDVVQVRGRRRRR